MKVTEAEYVGSFPRVTKCPPLQKPEYAFIGRSNVGKSSLINMLCNQKNLALTSNKPGKTQMINYFDINRCWYLVDLPGYGYAKISKTKRKAWEQMIQNFLIQRTFLQCSCVLIDANVPPQQVDLDFINWMGEMRLPFILIFTKSDKSRQRSTYDKNVETFKAKMLETWEELPRYFVTSAKSKEGQIEFLKFIEEVNIEFYDHYEDWKEQIR